MRHALHDVLQQTMRDMLGVREQVVEQTRKFCPDALISIKGLRPFKFSFEVNQGGGPDVSVSHALT